MTCLIVIPARLKSSRLKEKLLKKIHNKEIILWTASKVKRVGYDYVVAVDDAKMADVLERHQVPWIMTSDWHTNGTSRLSEVTKLMPDYKYYCSVQGDEPLVEVDEIRKFLDEGLSLEKPYIQAITRFSGGEDPNDLSNVKAVISKSGKLLYASRVIIPFEPTAYGHPFDIDKPESEVLWQVIGLYLFEKEFLENYVKLNETPYESFEKIEQLRCIENDISIQTLPICAPMLSIDTSEDFVRLSSFPIEAFQK